VKSVLIILAVGFVLFELVEHVIIPLIWFMKDRKKTSVCGATGMLGKVGEVKYWQESEGQVFVHGELWRAVSELPLSAGDRAVIQKVDGLTLRVMPFKNGNG
jgi:membrane-bound serine protease (ClpP class)